MDGIEINLARERDVMFLSSIFHILSLGHGESSEAKVLKY